MTANALIAAGIGSASALAAEPTPVELVDALNAVFGKHQARASHAKGFCAKGVFTPSHEAREFSSAKQFGVKSVPATVRFSIGGGNPAAPDKSRSVRGMAVRLKEGSEIHDLVLISEPAFFASTPASFVSFLLARVPDPETKKPNPAKIDAHNQQYPEGKTQPGLLAAHAAPFSYATTPYYSNHAFKFLPTHGAPIFARVEAQPVAGTRYLTVDEEKSLPDVFLEDELKARLAAGHVEFDIFAQPKGANDSVTNPAQVWGSENAKVKLGRLSIHGLEGQACAEDVFVPTNLPHGIEASDDPILKVRAAAYGVSKARRSSAGS